MNTAETTNTTAAVPTACFSRQEECKLPSSDTDNYINASTTAAETNTAAEGKGRPRNGSNATGASVTATPAAQPPLDLIDVTHKDVVNLENEETKEEDEQQVIDQQMAASNNSERLQSMALGDSPAQRILLGKNSSEYINVALSFHESRALLPATIGFAFRITAIEKVVNVELEKRFNEANEVMARLGHHHLSPPIQAVYHGTPSCNLMTIVREGFRVNYQGRAVFGSGCYLSPHPDYAVAYTQTDSLIKSDKLHELIQCDVLPGRQARLPQIAPKAARLKHFDSHASPNNFEWVIFDSHAILPRYIITFRAEPAVGLKFVNSVEAVKKNDHPVKQPCELVSPQSYVYRVPLLAWREKKLGNQDSPVFEINHSNWRIQVRPINAEYQNSTGVYVRPVDRQTASNVAIHILHPSLDPTKTITHCYTHDFATEFSVWGFHNVLTEQQVVEYTRGDGLVIIKVECYHTSYINAPMIEPKIDTNSVQGVRKQCEMSTGDKFFWSVITLGFLVLFGLFLFSLWDWWSEQNKVQEPSYSDLLFDVFFEVIIKEIGK